MEQFSTELRLGDVIDDHCIKCRRVTNHSIVSLVDAKAAKVRCRTCYHDHDYRNEQAPPTKKELLKQALFDQVLAAGGRPADGASPDSLEAIGDDPDAIAAALAAEGPEDVAETEAEIDDGPDAEEPVAAAPEPPPPPAKKTKARTKRA